MSEDVPESLEIEHEHLRSELHKAVVAGGRIGQAAERVLKVLRPHILLEEEFAIPPLTLLPRLARGEVTPDMRRYMTLAETLQAELPRMLDEHGLIVAALKELMRTAQDEGYAGYADVARKMILHAQTEEEIFYPASILIGKYLRSKLGK